MPGFIKAAAIVVSGGVIAGGALTTLPGNLRHSSPLLAAGDIGNLPSVPCEQQLWLNADRVCQTWTIPHRDVRRVLSPESAPAEPSAEPRPGTNTRVTSDEPATKARPRTSRAAARIARGEFVSRRMRMASRPVNVAQPGYTFWATPQQNGYSHRPRSFRRDMTRIFAFFPAP